MVVRAYKAKHLHSDPLEDLDCLGAPAVVPVEDLDLYKNDFIDWNVCPNTGVITSKGTQDWIDDGKTFIASPIEELDASLSHEQRKAFSPTELADTYSCEIIPNWGVIPEAIKNDERYMAQLEECKDSIYSAPDVWNFILDAQVTNLTIIDNEVSGYDHTCESQYIFRPIRNEK